MIGQRILVVGCSGSGKTTFSVKLGAISGLPVVHLDKFFWKPGWVQATREEFNAALQAELEKPAWILDGNYKGSLPRRLEYCDTVVYLDYPRRVCLWGIVTRAVKFYGQIRPDMGEGCPERFDWSFLKYTWNFEKEHGQATKELVKKSGKPVIWLRSRREAEKFLEAVRQSLH